MALLSPVLRSLEGHRVAFRCPGCKQTHQIYIGERSAQDPHAWTFDGNVHAPTFHPSVNARGIRWDMTDEEEAEYDAEFNRLVEIHGKEKAPWVILDDPRWSTRCHSFVRAGMIQFLSDCTHDAKNLTLPLDTWPDYENQEDKTA